jgi:hypothetical protein
MLLTAIKGEANGVIAILRALEVDRIDVKFVRSYSVLSASIGERCEALKAG